MGNGNSEGFNSTDREIDEKIPDPLGPGAYLRKERLKKSLSLQEIAEGTCIHIEVLRALEEDDESRMPAEVFTRGFLKLYAKYLGIDTHDILTRYNSERKTASRGDKKNQADYSDKTIDRFFSIGRGRKTVSYLVLILLIILLVLLYFGDFSFLK